MRLPRGSTCCHLGVAATFRVLSGAVRLSLLRVLVLVLPSAHRQRVLDVASSHQRPEHVKDPKNTLWNSAAEPLVRVICHPPKVVLGWSSLLLHVPPLHTTLKKWLRRVSSDSPPLLHHRYGSLATSLSKFRAIQRPNDLQTEQV